MANKVYFDPLTKIIEVTQAPVSGTVSLDFKIDVYSDGKEDWISDPTLNKLKFPVRSVGGDTISDTKELGSTFFLLYGWQIRPYSADHKLEINGNIYTDPAGTNVFLPASGSYSVIIESTVSNLSDSTIQQLPQIEYASFQNGVSVDVSSSNSGIVFPVGTPAQPVNNFADALLIAAYRGFDTMFIESPFTELDDSTDFSNFIFIGNLPTKSHLYVNSGSNVQDCEFFNFTLTGYLDGGASIEDCAIYNLYNFNGIVKNTLLEPGTLYITGSGYTTTHFLNCWSGVPGSSTPTIDMGGSGSALSIRNYNGGIEIQNKTGPEACSFDINSGQIRLTDSITAGEIVIRGVGQLTLNEATGSATVNTNGLMAKDTISDAVLNTSLISYTDEDTVADSLRTTNYSGIVSVDDTSAVSGTVYPAGTVNTPVNNITDAATIATTLGIDTIHIHGDYTFSSSVYISNLNIVGDGKQASTFTFENGAITAYCNVEHAKLSGYVLGFTAYTDCYIYNVTSSGLVPSSNEVIIKDCIIQGETSIPGNFTGKLDLINCWAFPIDGEVPSLNMNDGNFDVQMREFSGFMTLYSCSQATNDVRIFLSQGGVLLDESVTDGFIRLSGVGTLIDSSSVSSIDTTSLINQSTVATAVWDESIADHLIAGTTGRSIGVQQYDQRVFLSETGVSGTAFPIGTDRVPVNNLTDAKTIASNNGISVISIESNFMVSSSESVSGYTITSNNHSNVYLQPGSSTFYTNFNLLSVSGTLSGYTILDNCAIAGVEEFHGIMDRCVFNDGVGISSDNTKNAIFIDCYTGDVNGPPTLDCNGDGAKISMRGLTGAFSFANKTGATKPMFLDLYSARVGFESTIVTGSITIRGTGIVYNDESTNTTIDTTGLISKDIVAQAVWDEPIGTHVIDNTFGHEMYHSAYNDEVAINTISGSSGTIYPIGTHENPVDNLPDAIAIAASHSFSSIHVDGHLNISASEDISGYTILSDRSLGNSVTVEVGAITERTYLQDLTVDGTMGGSVRYTNCVLGEIFNFDGGAKNSLLTNDITITGTGANYFTECDTYITDHTQYKKLDVGDKLVNLIRCRGNYEIVNKTGTSTTAIDLVAGNVLVDNDCVSGSIFMDGIVKTTDNSAVGCNVITSNAVDAEIFASYNWDELLSEHTIPGSAGYSLANVSAGSNPNDIARAVWNDTASLYTTTSSFGYAITKNDTNLQLILGLVQHNFRMTNQVYDANGNMTSGEVNIYPSTADADTETNSIHTYYITAVYDGDNRLIDYKMIE